VKLPFIDKLGAVTGVFSRLNPMALLAKIKGKKGDDGEHSTVVLDEEEEDMFADLGDLDALDADIKANQEEAAAADSDDDGDVADADADADLGDVPDDDSDEVQSDEQALADLEAMPDFDEGSGDSDETDDLGDFGDFGDFDDDDDNEEDGDDDKRAKIKKMAIFAGGGIAAAILLGGVAWMILGGEAEPEVAVDETIQQEGVFSLDGLAPLKTVPSSALAPPDHAPAVDHAVVQPENDGGTLSGGTPIASSGLGTDLADLGLDKVQEPGVGIVVPSSTKASYVSLTKWPPEKALEVAPLSNLIKQTDIGPLPMVAQDGYSPFDAYARPEPPGDTAQPKIAIVVTGLGISRAATEAAIQGLPSDVSFSLDIYARGLDFWVKKMRSTGHEVLLEMPSESANFPFDDPGPAALRSLATLEENIQKLEFIMSRTSGYFGLLSVYGGKFLTVEEQVQGILVELKRRGLMYVDGGVKGSQGTRVAYKEKMPWASVELNLDKVAGQAALLRQFNELEALAQKRSMTVARISATPLSLKMLADWLKTLPGKQMRLVPVSSLANKQLIR